MLVKMHSRSNMTAWRFPPPIHYPWSPRTIVHCASSSSLSAQATPGRSGPRRHNDWQSSRQRAPSCLASAAEQHGVYAQRHIVAARRHCCSESKHNMDVSKGSAPASQVCCHTNAMLCTAGPVVIALKPFCSMAIQQSRFCSVCATRRGPAHRTLGLCARPCIRWLRRLPSRGAGAHWYLLRKCSHACWLRNPPGAASAGMLRRTPLRRTCPTMTKSGS